MIYKENACVKRTDFSNWCKIIFIFDEMPLSGDRTESEETERDSERTLTTVFRNFTLTSCSPFKLQDHLLILSSSFSLQSLSLSLPLFFSSSSFKDTHTHTHTNEGFLCRLFGYHCCFGPCSACQCSDRNLCCPGSVSFSSSVSPLETTYKSSPALP